MGFQRPIDWQVYDGAGRRKYLNRAERQRCLEIADTTDAEARALCYFLLFAGCRISEALALTAEQIEQEERVVWLRTLKRRKLTFRRIPLPEHVVEMLVSLARGKGDRLWTVHRVTAWRWIKAIAKEAGIEGPMACCRGLRHSYAMHAVSRQVPPFALRRFMGHASISTTMIYVDAVGAEEREFAERMWL